MPSYRDQIPEDIFSVTLVLVPDDDDDNGSNFAFQEQDQVKVGPAATQQGKCIVRDVFLFSFFALVVFFWMCRPHV